MKLKKIIALFLLFFSTAVFASELTVKVYEALPSGKGENIGDIIIAETPNGLSFQPNLIGLPPGKHGFHIHENPSCQPSKNKEGVMVPALAAGGHFDPNNTGKHLGPNNENGHLGDLPALLVNPDGRATQHVLAPRIKSLKEIKGRSLMIHMGGDNYSDNPTLGGGGARFACGLIE